jgi:xanthine dehydrogenase accessory factor
VLDYLLEEGTPQQVVDRVWAPAGLDLGAANPEEIALSIMSQIIALRRGGSVLSLKQKNEKAANDTSTDESPSHSATDKVIRQCETS